MPITTAPAPTITKLSGDRHYYFDIYESNLNDTDVHPITGTVSPGLHTRVVRLTTAKDFKINMIFNRPGSASLTLPLQSSEALSVVGYEVVRSLVVYCDDANGNSVPVWSGYVGNIALDSATQSINVNFVGWMDLLYHRELRQTCIFTNLDPADIALRLLNTANNQCANGNVMDLLHGAGVLNDLSQLSAATLFDSGYPVVDNTWFTTGTASVRLKATNKGSSYVQVGASNMIDAKGGDVINMSCDVMVYTNTATDGRVPFLQINWNNSGGSQRISAVPGTGQQKISGNVTVPPGVTSGTAYILLNTSATSVIDASFDNYVINNGATAEDVLLGVGDFEDTSRLIFTTASPGWSKSTAWSASGTSSLYLSTSVGASAFINPSLPYGSPNIADGANLIHPAYIPISGGVTYQAKIALNLVSILGDFRIKASMSWYDIAKTYLGNSSAEFTKFSTPLGEQIVVSNFSSATPSNAAYATISIDAQKFGTAQITAYVDALVIAANNVGLRKTPISAGTVDWPAGPVVRTRSYSPGQKIGQALEELSNIESGYDWEVALVDTPVYKQLANLIGFNMEANATYTNSAGQWRNDVSGPITVASTIARSTAQAYTGAASLAVTTTGVAGNKGTWYDMGGAAAGIAYSASAWVYVTTAQNITASIQGTGTSPITSTVAVPANTWTRVTVAGWTPSSFAASAGFYIYTSQTAAQTFYVDYANVLQSALPYDFETSTGNGPQIGTTLLRKMNVRYTTVKAGTTIKGIGSDRTNVVFGLQHDPNNLKSISETRDVSKLANRINGRKANRSTYAQDLVSINKYNLWEDTVTVSDAGITDDVLTAYAGSEIVFRATPTKIWNPTPIGWDGSPGKPRLWLDYQLGDIVYIFADDGALKIGTSSLQPVRLFGLTVSIDTEGNESIESLQTTASA